MNEAELKVAKSIYENELYFAEATYIQALSHRDGLKIQLKEIQRRLDELVVI